MTREAALEQLLQRCVAQWIVGRPGEETLIMGSPIDLIKDIETMLAIPRGAIIEEVTTGQVGYRVPGE